VIAKTPQAVVIQDPAMPIMPASWEESLKRVPREIILPGWVGPAFFTSELAEGDVVPLAAFRALLREHAHAQSLVFGTIREAQGDINTAYAAFCIDPRTGNVVLVDLAAPHRTRFVNTALPHFLASMATFAAEWPLFDSSNAESQASELRLREALSTIDAAAMGDGDDYWPTILEAHLLTTPA
jgi:hypothetical protein